MSMPVASCNCRVSYKCWQNRFWWYELVYIFRKLFLNGIIIFLATTESQLLVSLLFTDVQHVPHVLTQRIGIAAALACDRVAGVRPVLKWPNDLWLDERKLGGILIETVPAGSSRMAVIGVGLNVSDRAKVADSQLGTGFACLQELIPDITPPEALARLAPHYRDVLILYELHDLSYLEIATICQVDIGTVRSRLSRGRAHLRNALGLDAAMALA